MSATVTTAAAVAGPLTGEPGVAEVPARADGLHLLGVTAGSGYRVAPALVRRADGQVLQLAPLLYHVLEVIDGRRGYPEIADALGERIAKQVAPAQAYTLVEKLRPLGLLAGPGGAPPAHRRANPLHGQGFRGKITNPDITRRVTRPFGRLFRPHLALPILTAFALTTWWVLYEKGLAPAARDAFYRPGLLLVVFVLTVASAGFHELGHASACQYVGATPGSMGFGIYLVWPAFYTDVSDCYRLGRRQRLYVDLGGLYFNAVFGVAMFALWALTRWDAVLLVLGTQLLQMLRQLAPMIRADGYHIIADLVGVPDLFAHIKPTLTSVLPQRWRDSRGSPLRPWARLVVIGWVVLIVPALMFALVGGVLLFPRLAATAADSLGQQWRALAGSVEDLDVLRVLLRALSMFAIALPVLGTLLLVARMFRRAVLHIRRATAGHPKQRVLAVAAGVLLVSGVAWAWWPKTQYHPLQPGEQWALRQPDHRPALPAAPVAAFPRPTLTASGQPALLLVPRPSPDGARPPALLLLQPGQQDAELFRIAPGDPPEREPARASAPSGDGPGTRGTSPGPTSSPAQGTPPADSSWPFPFRPPPPDAGDTRAIAINTQDGHAVYDTAFAVVLSTDQWVQQRNEAYAIARCTGCRTVAVAFQAILVLGRSDVVTPVNAAVAVNYRCTRCETTAVAVQFVATLTGMPDRAALGQLQALGAQLEQLRSDLPNLSAEQIYDRLVAVKATMLQTLAKGRPDVTNTARAPRADEPPPRPSVPATPSPPVTRGMAGADAPSSETASSSPSPIPMSASPTRSPDPSGTEQQTEQQTLSPGTPAEVSPAPESSPSPDPSPTAAAQPAPSSEHLPAETDSGTVVSGPGT